MSHVIVIGGGASGMMAAIAAAREGAKVTLLEGMEKPGKKLLITGNGKCNFANSSETILEAYRGRRPQFAKICFEQFDTEQTLAFFKGLGVLSTEIKGGYYPYTEQASTICDALIAELRRLKVKIKCNERAVSIVKSGFLWKVNTETWSYEAEKVILTTGGKAAPQTGSDGSGYQLAEKLGHAVIPVHPALVPLKIKNDRYKTLAGLRSIAKVSLFIDGEAAKDSYGNPLSERGQLQWTDYGISGIAVFQLSRFAAEAVSENHKAEIRIDLLPDCDETELVSMMNNYAISIPASTLEECLQGILPKKLAGVLVKECGKTLKAMEPEEQHKTLIAHAKSLKVSVTGTKDFNVAQVTSGGVDTTEVEETTMESKLAKGIYFAGEILDIDGKCGGYNLQWAWSSGYVAGRNAALGE